MWNYEDLVPRGIAKNTVSWQSHKKQQDILSRQSFHSIISTILAQFQGLQDTCLYFVLNEPLEKVLRPCLFVLLHCTLVLVMLITETHCTSSLQGRICVIEKVIILYLTKWCKICVRVATNVAKEGNPSWPPKSNNETSVRHISYVNTHVWHSRPELRSPDQARRTGVTTHRTLNCDWTRCHLTAQQGALPAYSQIQ